MKKSYLLVLLLGIGFGITGCGNSNIDGFEESNSSIEVEKIELGIACTTPATFNDYIKLQSADKIVKDEENSIIRLYHDQNNLKRVCLQSGKAHIERANVE